MPGLDISHYEGREQAFVKHSLLKDYLSPWGYKVGKSWDHLIYVDGFAGPWGSTQHDYCDSSFGIAHRVLTKVVSGLQEGHNRLTRAHCFFVERAPNAFEKLEAFANSTSTDSVRAMALKGPFITHIPTIQNYLNAIGGKAFKFVFLDQKGWAGAPMIQLKPFLQSRGCEVLFNLMTSYITRFVDTEDERESSYHDLFGRSGVLDIIRRYPKGTGEREEAAVREYCKSLKSICGFEYVSQAVILEPGKEKVRYYLIFATNHIRGVEVFKEAETKAARLQDQVRDDLRVRKDGQPELCFDGAPPRTRRARQLRDTYCTLARSKVVELLLSRATDDLPFETLMGEALAFPLVTADDLVTWIQQLDPNIQIVFTGGSRRKKPREGDTVRIANRNGIR